MPRTASGWKWYAEMNDDIRSKLIDEAWFNQKRSNDMEQDVDRANEAYQNDVDNSAWNKFQGADVQQDGSAWRDLQEANVQQDGNAWNNLDSAEVSDVDPDFDDQGAIDDFYDEAREAEAERADVYGYDTDYGFDPNQGPEPGEPANASDLYGDYPDADVNHADLYGYDAQDMQQQDREIE